MSAALVVAALLAALVAAAHSYLGERYILVRLFRRSDLPRLFGSDRFTRAHRRAAHARGRADAYVSLEGYLSDIALTYVSIPVVTWALAAARSPGGRHAA